MTGYSFDSPGSDSDGTCPFVGADCFAPGPVESVAADWLRVADLSKAADWWKVAALYIVMILIFLVVATPLGIGLIWVWPMMMVLVTLIPLGIGLIWVWPMTMVAAGVVYHRLFSK